MMRIVALLAGCSGAVDRLNSNSSSHDRHRSTHPSSDQVINRSIRFNCNAACRARVAAATVRDCNLQAEAQRPAGRIGARTGD